jgi:hypothetical protein
MSTKAEAALTYASWGWHVIPVVPNGKIPATQHGVKDATTDPEQIAIWWAQNPEFNIGIAAGAKSGIVVFDVDPRNGGEESWSKWVEANGDVPDGLMALTCYLTVATSLRFLRPLSRENTIGKRLAIRSMASHRLPSRRLGSMLIERFANPPSATQHKLVV